MGEAALREVPRGEAEQGQKRLGALEEEICKDRSMKNAGNALVFAWAGLNEDLRAGGRGNEMEGRRMKRGRYTGGAQEGRAQGDV